MGQRVDLRPDRGNLYAVFAGQYARMDRMDGIRRAVGDHGVWRDFENPSPARTTEMDCLVVSCHGLDRGFVIAENDRDRTRARIVVYTGGGIVLYIRRDLLCMAEIKILPRDMAYVGYIRDGVFFLCGAVRKYY